MKERIMCCDITRCAFSSQRREWRPWDFTPTSREHQAEILALGSRTAVRMPCILGFVVLHPLPDVRPWCGWR